MVDTEGLHTPLPEGFGRKVGRVFRGVGRAISGDWLVNKIVPYPTTDEERRKFAHSDLATKRSYLRLGIAVTQPFGFYFIGKGINWLYRHMYSGQEINVGPVRNEAAVRIDAKTVEWSAVLGGTDELKSVGSVYKDTRYVWKKSPQIPSILLETPISYRQVTPTPTTNQEGKFKLEEYLKSLPQKPKTDLDKNEEQKLNLILQNLKKHTL